MRAVVFGDHDNNKWRMVHYTFQKNPEGHYYLDLWWKARSPDVTIRKKLYRVRLKNITMRTLGSLTLDECAADGFKSKEECLKWFKETYSVKDPIEEFKVYIIEWTSESCEFCRFNSNCTQKGRQSKDYFIPHPELNICPQFCPKATKDTLEFKPLSVLKAQKH